MPVNISIEHTISLAEVFRMLGQPVRIQILLVIAREEACVCHIEAVLRLRQAVISQHLRILRAAGLVQANREGRNIFYRLVHPELLDTVFQAASIAGLDAAELGALGRKPVPGCPCPYCNPGLDPDLSCRIIHSI